MPRVSAGGRAHPDDPGPERPSDLPRFRVEVRRANEVTVVALHGCLDAQAGRELVEQATAAVRGSPDRLDIDIRDLEAFTADGAAALVACRPLGAGLPEGLHYRTGQGPGRAALLAAYDGRR